MKLTPLIVKHAYRFVKSFAYHENLNLFLKHRVAKFESSNINESLKEICNALNSKSPEKNSNFIKWLNDIDHHILPKSISRNETKDEEEGLFLTNVRSSDRYAVDKVNYFISAPVELHIIEMLWTLIVGPVFDKKLTNDCFGNRLSKQAINFRSLFEDDQQAYRSGEIFKRYIDQYNRWRNTAIECASNNAKDDNNVAILSLDLQSYFYNINIDFDNIYQVLRRSNNKKVFIELACRLTKLLQLIFENYQNSIIDKLKITHSECEGRKGIPIGFASSSLLSNWHLSGFDEDISDVVRPAYYGRYVDDILLVFKRPKVDKKSPIKKFIEKYLPSLIIEKENLYHLISNNEALPLQKEKLILHYFDKGHSLAGLEVFKQELEERSSAFKFLPDEHFESEMDKFAYDILYDGSENKLRSIVGLAENETELARFLSSHITAQRLCRLDKKEQVLPQIKLFFRGANSLQFSRLWEKVYQYSVILNRYDFAISFYDDILNEIERISFNPSSNAIQHHNLNKPKNKITFKIKTDLKLYNELALSLCIGLLDVERYDCNTTSDLLDMEPDDLFDVSDLTKIQNFAITKNIGKKAYDFRKSNLIRHHLVAWPLANYTTYEGDLTNESTYRNSNGYLIDTIKIDLSPRFIHLDEWQLHSLNDALHNKTDLPDWQSTSIHEYEGMSHWENFPVSYSEVQTTSSDISISHINAGHEIEYDNLRIGIANLKLPKSDIEASIREDMTPNLSFERQSKLHGLLNNATKDHVNLLVMPEVAIPVSWLPFMVAYGRRNQIGLVFGLEHWVVDGTAYNLIIEVLPFKISGKYKSCVMTARLKNHYAPKELVMLEELRIKPAINLNGNAYYHKVNWRGSCFSTYNCFELSNIHHRAIFKSKIDLLITCVWNPDTNYYQHILESVVRDLHCYVIQSNTSQYGGSCILRPSKTETKTMLFVKGGENASILTTDLDINALRRFQFKSKNNPDDKFKPLPPGYDSKSVLHR